MLGRRHAARTALFLSLFIGFQAGARGERPWTIETSTNLRYFVEDPASALTFFITDEPARPVLPSPDATQFAVVTRRGNLRSDSNIYELRVYDTLSVENALRNQTAMPRPLRILGRRSRSSAGGIASLSWATSGHVLSFEGDWNEDSLQDHRVDYTYDVATGALTKTCGGADNARAVANNANAAICIAPRKMPASLPASFAGYPSYVVTPDVFLRLFNQAAPPPDGADARDLRELNAPLSMVVSLHGVARSTGLTVGAKTDSDRPTIGSISADGRHAVVLLPIADVPTRWRGYTRLATDQSPASKWMLIDTKTGSVQTMLDAPDGTATFMGEGQRPRAVWSPDGGSVVLFNTAMPLGTRGAASTAWIAIYDLGKNAISPVTPIQADGRTASDVQWTPDRGLIVEWTSTSSGGSANNSSLPRHLIQTFAQTHGAWSGVGGVVMATAQTPRMRLWSLPRDQNDIRNDLARVGLNANSRASSGNRAGSWVDYPPPQPLIFASGLHLTIDESADRPQRLVASLDERRAVLIDADPLLTDVAYNPPRVFEWSTAGGQTHRALLTLPSATHGAPPGLVVLNTQAYAPNVFRPDGAGASAFAQQLLAAKGMAVLQFEGMNDIGRVGETLDQLANHEIGRTAALLDTAIDELARQRLIDPARLGIVGFSHTGAIARSILIAPGRHHFRAAAENDSFNTGLAEYQASLLSGHDNAMGLLEYINRAQYHGGALWTNRAQWNSEAPDLAADRATGALLVVANRDFRDLLGVVRYASYFGAFTSAGRPIEFVSIPRGSHALTRPSQRQASLTVNVDWMDFWVNDHEDPDPAKAEQYARWRTMRTAWERQQAWEHAGNAAGTIPPPDFQQSRASSH